LETYNILDSSMYIDKFYNREFRLEICKIKDKFWKIVNIIYNTQLYSNNEHLLPFLSLSYLSDMCICNGVIVLNKLIVSYAGIISLINN
jgi:hypothetical protein